MTRKTSYEAISLYLSEFEQALLALEKNGADHQKTLSLFGLLQSIKQLAIDGEIYTVADFIHKVETVFDFAGKGKLDVTREFVDLGLIAGDHIKSIINKSFESSADEYSRTDIIAVYFKALMNRKVNAA